MQKNLEIEAKFVVLERTGPIPQTAMVVGILQTYLKPRKKGVECRVRKWTESGRTTFLYTEKSDTKITGQRNEHETPISWFRYILLILFRFERTCKMIQKTRYTYVHSGYVCEHDVYDGHLRGFETVEIEVPTIEELTALKLPEFIRVKNVTGDKRYSNRSLAEHGIPKLNQ